MAKARYEIEHSIGFSHFPSQNTQWLRERKQHLRGRHISFQRLRDALHAESSLFYQFATRQKQILDNGVVEAAIKVQLRQHNDIPWEIVEACYEAGLQSLCYVMARMSEEMAVVLNIPSKRFTIDGRSPQEEEVAKITAEITQILPDHTARVTLSGSKLYAAFTALVSDAAEQRGLAFPSDYYTTDGIANLISNIAHGMHHVRSGLFDRSYYEQTELAGRFLRRARRRESFATEAEWQTYQRQREVGEKIYRYNIGEYAAVKFQRLFLLFLKQQLSEMGTLAALDHRLLHSLDSEVVELEQKYLAVARNGRERGELLGVVPSSTKKRSRR